MIPFLPSQTAEVVCWMRAAEHRRAPAVRIVDDPYAAAFLSLPYRASLRVSGLVPAPAWDVLGLSTYVTTRHRYIDDAVLAAGPIDQVVLLGAGYDARLYRLPLASARRFEVDHPSTGARKAARVAAHPTLPPVAVVRVPVDFATESLRERLLACGFEPGRRTCWVWEGVSMYLDRAAVVATTSTLRDLSGPGSRLAMDWLGSPTGSDAGAAVHRVLPSVLGWVGEPVTLAVSPDESRALLAECGFRVIDLAEAGSLEQRYVRDGRRAYPHMYALTAELAG
ncbi:MAG: SAM-dependent methyltransferase [Myxococcota bacterium]